MFTALPISSQDFYIAILSKSIQALKFNTFHDNFDKRRYNPDGVDRSGIFDIGSRVFYFDWFHRNNTKLF